MRIHPSALVAGVLALAFPFTGALAAQETEREGHGERHEAHAEHHEGAEKAQERMSVALKEVNESGIEGKARMSHDEEADSHQVTLKLKGTSEGLTYPAHIHQGSCETGGPVVVALSPVEAGPEMATSTTSVVPEEVLAQAREIEAQRLAEAEGRAEDPEYVEARGDIEEAAADEERFPPLFVQIHAPDGTPVACGDIPHAKKDRDAKDGEKTGERDRY